MGKLDQMLIDSVHVVKHCVFPWLKIFQLTFVKCGAEWDVKTASEDDFATMFVEREREKSILARSTL